MDIGGHLADVCLIPKLSGGGNDDPRDRHCSPLVLPMLDGPHRSARRRQHSFGIRPMFGRVKVGPRQHGCAAGPACYGLGGEQADLTDIKPADGLLIRTTFANGEVPLTGALGRGRLCKPGRGGRSGSMSTLAALALYSGVATNQIAEAIRT